MNQFDVAIVGAGVAGAFATLKIAKDYPKVKTVVFDIGRPPAKRKSQLLGFLGCLPSSDGKLYSNDVVKVTEIAGVRRAKSSHNYFNKIISEIGDFQLIKDRGPSVSMQKKIKKNGFVIQPNDYSQILPKEIHALSKKMAALIETPGNITFHFDNEAMRITKKNGWFVISSESQEEFKARRIIIAAGRSGWRWTKDLYNDLGIIDNNDFARFGIRVEMAADTLTEMNCSPCSLIKDDLELGPFSWNGTVIPEDHVDMAISAFRSNENRWHTDKVSFSIIGNRPFPNSGSDQVDRLGKLTFLLANDRVLKEKISTLISKKSVISIIPEYDWLVDTVKDVSKFIPQILSKAYYHVPTIIPMAPKINVANNLETDIEGMFVAGESAGISGILSAAMTGIISADSACK